MATKAIVRRVYIKRKAHRRSHSMTLPLAVIGGFVPLGMQMYTCLRSGQPDLAGRRLVAGLTGYDYGDGQWKPSEMRYGLAPILGGFLVHKVASRLGINRALAQANVPFVRI